MIITVECPSCNTTFPVDPRKVPAGGVKVRCSACSGIFFVDEPEPIPAAPLAPVPTPQVEAARRTPAEVPVDEDRAHVDPWSGSGFDHHEAMGDAGHGEGPSDPWSGGVGLSESDEAADEDEGFEAREPEDGDEDFEAFASAGSEEAGDFEAYEADGPEDDHGAVALDEAAVAEEDRETFEATGSFDPHEAAADESVGFEDGFGDESEPSGPDDWMLEKRQEVDFSEPVGEVERMETVEEQVRAAASELSDEEATDDGENPWDAGSVPPAAEAPVHGLDEAWHDGAGEDDGSGAWDREASAEEEPAEPPVEDAREAAAAESPVEAAWEEEAAAEPALEAGPAVEPEPAPEPPSGFQFGKRDPHEKARRLARVLVSDMITYNPDRHRRALERGTLHADFEEEIRKSWAEYTDQVGRELAESTTYWFDALNEILARGEKVF